MHELLQRIRPERGCRFDILGLGGCSLDELWRLPSDANLGAALDDAPIPARARDQLGGGAVATTMVAARRLGLRAAFCGAVGVDDAGRTVVQGLRDEGVDTSGVRMLGQARTRCTLTLLHGNARRRVLMVNDPALFPPEGVPSERDIAATRIVHIDLTFPQAAERLARATQQGRGILSLSLGEDLYSSGSDAPAVSAATSGPTPLRPDRMSLPPGPGSPLPQCGPADARAVDALLAQADLCVMTSGFAQRHTGVAHFEHALVQMARRTPATVLVATLGERGCVAVDREESGERLIYCPAVPVVPGSDRTSCGAAFRAALLCYLLRLAPHSQQPLESAMRFANAAAALKCRALGRRGCPTLREVEHLLSAAPLAQPAQAVRNRLGS